RSCRFRYHSSSECHDLCQCDGIAGWVPTRMNEGGTLMRRIVIRTLVLICLQLFARTALTSDFSVSEMYPIDTGHSYIGFSIKYMGFAHVRGRFTNFSGTFRFVEKDITKSSATVIIKADSINTDLEIRDKDLKSPNWFDVEKYPLIKFQTKKII